MGIATRLIFISILSPALTHLIGIAYSEVLVFTLILSYPIMVIVTLLMLLPLHHLFLRKQFFSFIQLPIIIVCGAIGGYLIMLCFVFSLDLSFDYQAQQAKFYIGLGVLAAICCWMLYNWGPFRIAFKQYK